METKRLPKTTKLTTLLEKYAKYRDIRQSTVDSYSWKIKCFSKHLGHEATLADLTPDVVNGFIRDIQKTQSAFTCKGTKIMIATIWRFAASLDLVPPPKQLRQIKMPEVVVKTLNRDQIEEIRTACRDFGRQHHRWFDGHSVAGYMLTAIDATMQTALRWSDLRRIKMADLETQPMSIVQYKTGHRRLAQFDEELLNRIREWKFDRELWLEEHHQPITQTEFVWPSGNGKGLFTRNLRRIGQRIGIKGLTHTFLRKCAISLAEEAMPGGGWVFAGHRTPCTTQQWYTDRDRQYRSVIQKVAASKPATHQRFVGFDELSKMFGMAKGSVQRLARQDGFPKSFAMPGCGNLQFFRLEDVLGWARANHRIIHDIGENVMTTEHAGQRKRPTPNPSSSKDRRRQSAEAGLLDVYGMSDLLMVCVRTIRTLQSQAKLPQPVLIGRSMRWRRQEVIEWAKANHRVVNDELVEETKGGIQ
jgi:predicted DNA-binding transcriptional regulator AlpA/site-specific recombinase XerD